MTVPHQTEQYSDIEEEETEAYLGDSDEHEIPSDAEEHDIPTESSNVDIKTQITDVIGYHDILFLAYDLTSGKAIVSDTLRTELVQKGSIFVKTEMVRFK